MRIASWNMDHWRRTQEKRARAWKYLTEEVQPDVALLQETMAADQGSSAVWRIGGMLDTRKEPPKQLGWGSAVVSYGPRIESIEAVTGPFDSRPTPLLRTFPGSVAVAKVASDTNLVVVSTYGVIDRGYADATVHRILSDLEPLIDQRQGKGIVLAGDLNITTQWSSKHRSFLRGRHDEQLQRDCNLFDRFSALGLHNVVTRTAPGPLDGCDCVDGSACRHVQTQRHDRSSFPWQNDYIFLSQDLLGLDHTVEVYDREEAWELSGHCPIVVEFPGMK